MYVNRLNLVPVCKDICELESENPWSLPDGTNYKTIKHETQVLRMTQFKTGEGAIKKVKKDILLDLVENKEVSPLPVSAAICLDGLIALV